MLETTKLYLIRKYDMIGGVVLFTHEEKSIPVTDIDKVVRYQLPPNTFYSKTPIGEVYKEDGLLPYKAIIKQDLPSCYTFKPKVFNNCQLMMKRKASYNYFKDLTSDEELLIATNSHKYVSKK